MESHLLTEAAAHTFSLPGSPMRRSTIHQFAEERGDRFSYNSAHPSSTHDSFSRQHHGSARGQEVARSPLMASSPLRGASRRGVYMLAIASSYPHADIYSMQSLGDRSCLPIFTATLNGTLTLG